LANLGQLHSKYFWFLGAGLRQLKILERKMEKSKIAAGIVAGVLAIGYIGGNVYASGKAEEVIAELASKANSGGVDISYSDVSANIFGTVEIEGVTGEFQGGTYYVDTVTISGIDPEAETFEGAEIAIDEFSLSIPEDKMERMRGNPPRPDLHRVMMYLMLSEGRELDLTLSVDVDGNDLLLDELSIGGSGIGHLSISTELFLDAPPKSDMQTLMALGNGGLKVGDLTISFEDDGIVDVFFLRESKRKNASTSDLIDDIVNKLEKTEAQNDLEEMMLSGFIGVLEGDEVVLSRGSDEPSKINFKRMFNNPKDFIASTGKTLELEIDVN
jgi:hypothetical protein